MVDMGFPSRQSKSPGLCGRTETARSGSYNTFAYEPLFRPFRPVHRPGRVDRLGPRLLCHSRSSILRVLRRNTDKRYDNNESELAYKVSAGNPARNTNKTRRCSTHLRVRHSINTSIKQVMNESGRKSKSEQR